MLVVGLTWIIGTLLPEREGMLCTQTRLLAAALLSFCGTAHAQHVSLWAGAGLGSFLSGGSGVGDPNAHRIAGVSVSLAGDRLELRALKGTLERPRGIPVNAGDDDFDYVGFDALITRHTTGLPVDVALGAARYEEVYPLGYPHPGLGGRTFVHRWGPHASALRSLGVGRFGQVWVETDLHYAPYRPRQLVLFLDIGIGVHL